MYAENGKISSRQTFRLYVFDLIGIATLLLPPYLAKLCGIGGIWAIMIGTGAGIVYLYFLGWILKQMQTDAAAYLKEQTGRVFRFVAFGSVYIHSLITAGFCAYVFSNLMRYTLVKETTFFVVLCVIVLVSAYAVSGGIESRARVYEVLFLPVLIPYIAMMLATTKDFEWEYVAGISTVTGGQLAEGSFLVYLFLTPLFYLLFLVGEKEKSYRKTMIKTILCAIVVSAIILLFSYVLLVGNFGSAALSTMRFPVVTVMSTIQFKGNFLKRMDALMLGVWFFTLYALLNLHLHYGVSMLKEMAAKKEQQVKLWQLLLPVGVVLIVACGLEYLNGAVKLFLDYYAYVAVPYMVVFPILVLIVGGKHGSKKQAKR